MTSTKQFSEFTHLIPKLDVNQFTGLCAVLCVKQDIDGKSREFTDVLSDVFDNFEKLPRASRKDLLRVLKLAIK